MNQRSKGAGDKSKSGVKNPIVNPSKITKTGPGAGTLPANKYINRLRWDEKAKMYTVVDIPKRGIKE